MYDLTPKKLAEALVEKHDRYISEYSDEVEKMQQVMMLREKKDQLLHWVEENGSRKKYEDELRDTQEELENLESSFKPKSQSHYRQLDSVIEEHKKARKYWLDKIGELKS